MAVDAPLPVVDVMLYGIMSTALLDTGAVGGNFIDEDFFDKRVRLRLSGACEIHKCNREFGMANRTTKVKVDKYVVLEVTLKYADITCVIKERFYIMTLNNPFIIGLHTLAGAAFPVFCKMFERFHDDFLVLQTAFPAEDAVNAMSNVKASLMPFDPIYPNLRCRAMEEVNRVFKDSKVMGSDYLEIRDTERGWGIFATKDIPPDKVCMSYTFSDCSTKYPANWEYAVKVPHGVYEPDSSYHYLPLANDAFSHEDNNIYYVTLKDHLGLYGKTGPDGIAKGKEVCVGYGGYRWDRYLEDRQYRIDGAHFKKIHDQVRAYYGSQFKLSAVDFGDPMPRPYDGGTENVFLSPFSCKAQVAEEEEIIPACAIYPSMTPEVMNGYAASFDARNKAYDEQVEKNITPEFLNYSPGDGRPTVRELFMKKFRRTYVTLQWEGIKNKDGSPRIFILPWISVPPDCKVKSRQINPRLIAFAFEEYSHLLEQGFFVICSTTHGYPLVIAPKATLPFIRLCGDYRLTKAYLYVPQEPIKPAKYSLEKVQGSKLFADIDMKNAFHQFRLDQTSSERLALVTPWGHVRPVFLPEGIGPASGMLQRFVQEIFADFEPWSIVLFDNFLILGKDEGDLYEKLIKFMERCADHNLILNMSKCFIGVTEVTFFGYVVNQNGYRISPSRTAALQNIEFPGDAGVKPAAKVKHLQVYLGTCNFMIQFVDDYARRTAPLYGMLLKNFNWDEKTWTQDYRRIFEEHKRMMSEAFMLFYPDYSLTWTVRTDASQLGMGGIVFQRVPKEGKPDELQPIGVCSHKFSASAQKWITIVQECFGIFYTIRHFQYLLRCKHFVLETDHANLLWMEKSVNPLVVRMFQFLCEFNFSIFHIPGKQNVIADGLSRLFPEIEAQRPEVVHAAAAMISHLLSLDAVLLSTEAEELASIDQVHGGRAGHHGIRRTWDALNKFFPGHNYSIKEVARFIDECWVCQKTRALQIPSLVPLRKNLTCNHARHVLAWDTVGILPDKAGNKYILVVVNLFTKFVTLFAVPDKTAETTASCMFRLAASEGTTDICHSDMGSDFDSAVVRQLNKLLGITQTFALVGHPEADGVEPYVKEVIRHLTAIVMDERVKDSWSDPTVLSFVQMTLNSRQQPSGFNAFQIKYGLNDAAYCGLPDVIRTSDMGSFVEQYTSHLEDIRAISKTYLDKERAKRADPPSSADTQNVYKPGDYVLFLVKKIDKPDKLTPRNEGPYVVLSHRKGSNEVEVRSLITNAIFKFSSKDLKIFIGSGDEAFKAAQTDNDQFVVSEVIGYTGDPVDKRSKCQFAVRFSDGTVCWKRYTPDITETEQFEIFCRRNIYTSMLLMNKRDVDKLKASYKNKRIDSALVNTEFFFNIRNFGVDYYDGLSEAVLPNKYTTDYVCRARYANFDTSANLVIHAVVLPFNYKLVWGAWEVYLYGGRSVLAPTDVLLSDEQCKLI